MSGPTDWCEFSFRCYHRPSDQGRSKMSQTVLTGSISHETNTFSSVRTDLDAFRRGSLLIGGEVFPVRRMCAVLDVSPAGYYAWRGRPESYRSRADRALLAEAQRLHGDSNRRHGSPRVHATLRAE